MSLTGVTGELLIRYLDTWVPTALHAGRRVTFVQAWPQTADVDAAESALRVFAEFADRFGDRRVSLVFVAPSLGDAAERLATLQAELVTPASLSVYPVAGRAETHLAAVLTAAQAAAAPIFAYVQTPEALPVRAVAAGKPAEFLGLTDVGGDTSPLQDAFPLVSVVELVTDDDAKLLVFGTASVRSLEAFKNALWQLDEWAGVQIRDPHDAEGHLLDISLHPHPGPLRREILAYLAAGGPRTVTEIRRFALTETVYRVSDVTDVVTALIASGAAKRTPPTGRVTGDTVLSV